MGVKREAMTGLAGLGPLLWPPSAHTTHPARGQASAWPPLNDEEAEGEREGKEGNQGARWGEATSAQGLGGPKMVRWLQRSGQEDTVVWAASEKQQSTSFFRPYCVVVVMGPGGTCWGSFRGTCVFL